MARPAWRDLARGSRARQSGIEMFSASAALYDLIYASIKDYRTESAAVARLLRERHPACRTVLDVGCGTGAHARLLAEAHGFLVDGLDLDPDFVQLAAAKQPHGRFYHADMRDFQIPHRYDAIVCLFSSIGYVRTTSGLTQALRCFAAHLGVGGVVVVEPWFEPGIMQDGYEVTHTAEGPDIHVVRRSRTELMDRVSRLHFEYLVEAADGVRTFHETHELGLFTVAEMQASFVEAGLAADYDSVGLTGRGLYVARTMA